MKKITYNEYIDLAQNPDTSEEQLMAFSRIQKGSSAFSFNILPDPEKVDLSNKDLDEESAMLIANKWSRIRRQTKFKAKKLLGSNLPILIAEGDSWFEFPILVNEIVDQLEDDYLIWSIASAGDTAELIVEDPEYPQALKDLRGEVRGFMFSAAGNDIIGEDDTTKKPVLFDLLNPYNGNTSDIEGHINIELLTTKIEKIRFYYLSMIHKIRNDLDFKHLPIIIHGYDYAIPYSHNVDDPRNPIYASKDEWLGAPLDQHKITDTTLQRNIIKYLIDRLYQMMLEVAGDSLKTGVWLVDCRGSMPDVTDWIDEIHGTSDGFRKVAERFKAILKQIV